MPTSTGAFIDAEIESTEKHEPCEPGSGKAGETLNAACRSVNTVSHWRNTRSTFGSLSPGSRLPGPAARTQVELTGLVAEASEHWKTPFGRETIATSVVPPSAPPAMSTRQLPSAATVATTLRAGPSPAVNLYSAANVWSSASAARAASEARAWSPGSGAVEAAGVAGSGGGVSAEHAAVPPATRTAASTDK